MTCFFAPALLHPSSNILAEKMWNLLAWLKRKRATSEKYQKENVEIIRFQLHQQESENCSHGVAALSQCVCWHVSLPLCQFLFCLDFFIFFTQTTNKGQTRKPVIIPVPERHMDELVSRSLLERLWPEVHLSAAHWGRKKNKTKEQQQLCVYSQNCPDFNRAHNHIAPNRAGTKNIYGSSPERITVCALPIFSSCLPPNGTWAFSGFLARGRFVPTQRPYSKNVSCYPCLLQDVRNNLHYVWCTALTMFSFDVQKY